MTDYHRLKSLNKEETYHELIVHLTLLTKMIHRNEDDDYQCICSNHLKYSKEEAGQIFQETEIVPSLKVPITKDGKIKLVDIVNTLKLLGYPITGSMINIFMRSPNEYVLIGADPIDSNIILDRDEVDMNYLKLKIVNYLERENMKHEEEAEKEDRIDNKNDKKKERRTKERKIGFIIEKVNAWRKLYHGFYNEKGEQTRYTLDQAAKIIDISKKSLDDYLLQLRLGRKYGFDFNKHQNEKVGMLRVFVKSHRHTETKEKSNV